MHGQDGHHVQECGNAKDVVNRKIRQRSTENPTEKRGLINDREKDYKETEDHKE